MYPRKILNNLLPIFFIFIFSLLVSYPILRYSSIFRGNDLIANISGFIYLKEILSTFGRIPQWNFYLGTGFPTMSDPLNSYFNPLLITIYSLFDIVTATKYLLFILVFTSGVCFYSLSRHFKINRIISVLVSLTYMCSGYLAARLVGGHLEKMIAYVLIPIFYKYIFTWVNSRKEIIAPIVIGAIMGIFILSGSIYEVFYGCIILGVLCIYVIYSSVTHKKDILLDILTLIFFSSLSLLGIAGWKVIPMMEYSYTINRAFSPYAGSQNILSILYSFFIFGDPSNSTLPNSIATSPYRWWESMAYIGPLPFFSLIYWHIKKINVKNFFLIILIEVVLILYSMINTPLNPFFWLVKILPFLQNFRIPSRIFIYLVPLFLLIFGEVAQQLYIKARYKVLILIVILINTYFVFKSFRYIYYQHNFPFVNKNFEPLLNHLKQLDNSYYYIGQDTLFDNQLPLYIAVKNHQKILNPTYGYSLKNYDYIAYANIDMGNAKVYNWIYPKYFIYSNRMPSKIFSAKAIKKIGDATLYKSSFYSPYAYLTSKRNVNIMKFESNFIDSSIITINTGPDLIEIKVNSNETNLKLVVLELKTEGWQVYIDKKQAPMKLDKYLSVGIEKGMHIYTFKFLR